MLDDGDWEALGLNDRLADALTDELGDGEGLAEADGDSVALIDDDGEVELDGLVDDEGDGDDDDDSERDTLLDGEADDEGEGERDSEADGLSDERPVPSGVVSSSRNRHATTTVLSVSQASSNWSASSRQNFNSETMRRLVNDGSAASKVRVSFTVPSNAMTRRNFIDPSQ